MKPFETYQYIGGEMTDRDKKQVGSKFWGKGKWDNFIKPHIKKAEGTFVEMGCNAGIFLKEAEDMGFDRVIGVEGNEVAVQKGMSWKGRKHFKILHAKMENSIDKLPIADYTLLANAHYYFNMVDWVDYLDKIKYKTKYIIIVTGEKRQINRCWTRADIEHVRNYFRDWKEVSFQDKIQTDGDPDPRNLQSICFENPHIEKVKIDSLDSSNHVQDEFYDEIDRQGKNYRRTRYYLTLRTYRKKWRQDQVQKFIEKKMEIYFNLKEEGQKTPIYVDNLKRDWILDGNHRYAMMRSLGYKEIFVRFI